GGDDCCGGRGREEGDGNNGGKRGRIREWWQWRKNCGCGRGESGDDDDYDGRRGGDGSGRRVERREDHGFFFYIASAQNPESLSYFYEVSNTPASLELAASIALKTGCGRWKSRLVAREVLLQWYFEKQPLLVLLIFSTS
ncbi:hypothetical protein H5410_021988, partial [Solanum commersonii]